MSHRIDSSIIGSNMNANVLSYLVDSGKIKLKDVVGNVKMYNSEYTTSKSDMSTFRSVACEQSDDGVCTKLFVGLPCHIELNEETVNETELDLTDCTTMISIEGTIIRAFYAADRWFTSTNRKLDAFKSKWASKRETFGERFCKAVRKLKCMADDDIVNKSDEFVLNEFYEKLGRDRQHMFILKASEEERIVCKASPDEEFVYIGSFHPIEVDLRSVATRSDDRLQLPIGELVTGLETRGDISEKIARHHSFR